MKTYDAQVCVIAGGPAGLSAAVSAAEKGMKVVLLEKAAAVGGAANMGMGPLGIGTKYQKAQMVDITVEKAFNMFMEYTHYQVDARLVKRYFSQSASTIEWLESMGVEFEGEITKFDYAIALSAALCYLMICRQDPVGLIAFDEKIRRSLPPKSRRSQFGSILSTLANLKPTGETNVAAALTQLAGMLKRASLVMIFSDLLGDPDETLRAIYRLRHSGHDVILFHILGAAETKFSFRGNVELQDPETGERIVVDADSIGADYRKALEEFRETFRREGSNAKFDYVPLDVSIPFDKALLEYLTARSQRR